ncbi:phage holin family protein [Ligilactobacillus cholophilus]|uniref:phage holin family protein n=1 Tax=Ligilactobacillus cholophilus TaxID=3050131 RepID=UPI0025B0971E|nr:phage holin family protein [Ligilactobacillus cholophilus]
MGFWKRSILDTLIFIAVAGFFPNLFHVSNIWMAFVAAVVMGLLNRFIKPIIVLFSLPITILTFGLFYICINAFMLQLASWALAPDFYFSNFGSAIIVAIIISIVNMIVSDYFEN